MAMEFTTGLMGAGSKVIGKITKSQASVSIFGPMEERLKDIGNKTTCMVKEFTNGQMVGSTKEATWKIESKDMESTPTLMEDAIKETGKMVSKMEMENLLVLKALLEKDSGKMGRGYIGLMNWVVNGMELRTQ